MKGNFAIDPPPNVAIRGVGKTLTRIFATSSTNRLPVWGTYVLGVAVTLVTLYLRIATAPWFGERPVLIVFVPAIMLGAYIGGLRLGLLSTAVAVLGADYFLIEPKNSFSPGNRADVVDLIILAMVGGFISLLMESLLHARQGGERALAESKRAEATGMLLTAIVESSSDAIIGKDLDGIVTSWNAGAERIFGYSAAEMVGNSITMLIPPERMDDETQILRRVKRGERVEHFETVRVRKDGELIDVAVTVSPINDDEGNVIGASKVARDITERKKEQKELADNRAQLQAIFDNMTEAVMLMDLNFQFVQINPLAATLHGLINPVSAMEELAEKVEGVSLTGELILPEDWPLARAVRGDFVRNYEMGVRRKDNGKMIFAACNTSAITNEAGEMEQIILTFRDITGQKRAAEALRESDERLRTVTDTAQVGLVMVDEEHRYRYANRAYATMLNLPPGDIVGKRVAEVLSPVYETEIRPRLQRAFNGERVEYALTVPPLVEGDKSRHYAVTYQPGMDRSQAVVIVVIVDVTERRHAEEAQRMSDARYRTLFEYSPDGIMIADPGNHCVDANPEICRMLGYNREEMIGRHASTLIEPAEVAQVKEINLRSSEYQREWQLRRKDGSLILVEVTSVRLPNDNRLGIIRDITERKRAEEALRASEERLQTVTENLSEGLIISDIEGRLLHWNRAGLEIHGFNSLEEGLRSLPEFADTFELSTLDGNVLPVERWPLARILAGECLRDNEIRIRRHGTDWERIFNYSGEIVHDAAGRAVSFLAINDITLRKQAEEKIRNINIELEAHVAERTAQLEEANKELEAFSYSVSHDLRAPLRAMNGFAVMVKEEFGSQLPAEGARYLERIRQGSLKMGQLIDDLLAFSRLSRQPLKGGQVNMGRLVQSVLNDLAPEREGRKIDIQTGVMPDCWGDSALLKQVWVNLLSNAIKYTRGCERALVETGCESENGENIYYVRDNGAGFDMKYVHKLFGVFQRLHLAEDFEGTGVGLAIVQRIVHRHGGRVWAEAEKGNGAIFRFTLGERKEI